MSHKLQWPETVDQAVGVLLGLLPDGEKAKIAAMSQDDLVALHLGMGMWRVGRDYGNFGRNGIKVLNCNKKRKRQLGEFD